MSCKSSSAAGEISAKLELAMLLEVSAHPKPGNIHRTRDYEETSYEHYLASAVASGAHFERAAQRGILLSSGAISPKEACVGSLIRDAVVGTLAAQRGGNTSLGTLTLLVPIAVAAGMTLGRSHHTSPARMRNNLRGVLRRTSVTDAVAFYEAVVRAKPGGLGRVEALDVQKPDSRHEILRREINLFQIFKLAANRDSICSEWITDYEITFELGYPYFERQLSKTGNLNEATVNTYLRVLSKMPDTLITRKAGPQRAIWVSKRARKALDLGGASSSAGLKEIHRLDEELIANRHLLNPGATADITAAILSVALLSGYKP